MDVKLSERIKKILILAGKQKWNDKLFSLEKAQVCAELCAIVYNEIREYELKKASRIHLFASNEYRKIVEFGKPNDIFPTLSEIQGDARARFFIIHSRYAIILGVNLNDVVILAIRGTVFFKLWDWKANVDTRKYHFEKLESPDSYRINRGDIKMQDAFFHRGFFEAIVPQFPSIGDAIKKYFKNENIPAIVWTGHSLGGAMAATANAMQNKPLADGWRNRLSTNNSVAYTFGMPRYCGLGITCNSSIPYHIYNEDDLVPTVPLRRTGFSDCPHEFVINAEGNIEEVERIDTFGVLGHIPNVTASLKAHSIEGYAESIAHALNCNRP